MKKLLLILLIVVSVSSAFSQDLTKFHIYNPDDNAEKEIAKSVKKAKAENKHVFIQIGNNACIWCARFNDLISNDEKIDSIIKASYIIYHMNCRNENDNAKILAKYNCPQRFGFPFFLVLNGKGKLIHMQGSWYLQDGNKSYDRDKTISFFNAWSPAASQPKQ